MSTTLESQRTEIIRNFQVGASHLGIYSAGMAGEGGPKTLAASQEWLRQIGAVQALPEAPITTAPTQDQIGNLLILKSKEFVNLTEIKSNASWARGKGKTEDPLSPLLRAEMKKVGWKEGWPYCIAACEALYRYTYEDVLHAPPAVLKLIAETLSPSVMNSFTEAEKRGLIVKVGMKRGAICFMRHGRTWNGHAEIFDYYANGKLNLIGANTSPSAKTPEEDRNGDGIYEKGRPFDVRPSGSTSGLHIIGFMNPPTW